MVSYGQCDYAGATSSVGTYTFCIDNSNTITTANVKAGQYAVVNVVKGFNYTFSVGNLFTGDENLTLFNAADNSNFGATGYKRDANGVTINNWTSPISGKIKVQLSRGSCNNTSSVNEGALTLTLNSIGNTQDSQALSGTNIWVGHVYNWTGGSPPGGTSPTTPSALNTFTDANYVGYYNIASETINEDFGGNTVCFPVTSAATNIYTEQFAVRYRMLSTKKGYYFLNVTGDDGVRVYVDGVLVFNEWKEQSPTNYCNNLIYLSGTSDIVLDYYENGGQNEVKFSLTAFTTPNVISGATTYNVCSGTSPGTLDANAYAPCSTQTTPNVTYQWQTSTDKTNWINVASGGTTEDYAVPVVTTTTTDVRYFRRLVKSKGTNEPTTGGIVSNVIRVNTSSNTALNTPGSITGTVNQCASSVTEQVYSITAVTNALNYTWTVPTGWTITEGQGTTSIKVTTGSAGQNGNISVTASNGCQTSIPKTLGVTVRPTVGGTVSSAQTICSGTQPANLTLSGQTGAVVKWQKSNNAAFTGATDINVTTLILTGATIGNLTVNTYFRAVVQSGSCAIANSAPVLISIYDSLGNNYLSYSNGTSGQVNASVYENDNAVLTAPTGTYFATVNFASYGTPTGTSPNFVINSVCHASTSQSKSEEYLLGKTGSITIPATNAVFGDPCGGTYKKISVLASYAQPVCNGKDVTIYGTTPTGGSGTYTYKWQSSTTSATSGFVDATGTNTGRDYTSGVLTQTTWFRRVVTSCSVSTSFVVLVKVNPVFTAGAIATTGQTICYNGDSSIIGSTTAASGGDGTITYKWQANNVDIASSNSATYDPPSGLTVTTTYKRFAKDNTCNTTFTASTGSWVVTVNPASEGGTVSGGTTPICQGSSTGTLTLSGHIGTVVKWEKRLNSGSWEYAAGNVTTFSETPYASGTWDYRAVVQSGSCSTANSSLVTIVVAPTPVGGGIYTGNTPICINSSTGSMNLTGYTGSVVRWEKRLLPSTTWTTIINTTDTYSESPSVGGTWEYRALVGSGNCTAIYSSVRSVTVNPELTITLTNSNATICQNTTIASFAYSSTTGSPANWVVNFDAAAKAAGIVSPQNSGLSGAPSTFSVNVPWDVAAGTYNATLTVITNYPTCSSVSYPISVTVGVSIPTVGTITHPTCSTPTGSVVLSGLPATGTVYQTGTVVKSYAITGTSMTISGLGTGTYQFAASNGSCTSSATDNVTINPLVAKTWNGANWIIAPSPTAVTAPSADEVAIFASGTYSSTGDLAVCSCQVTGATVTFNPGNTLTVTNAVTVSSGSLTFENTASLVQINNVTNSGNITYKRITPSLIETDYTYWSSPVLGQKLEISPDYTYGTFYSYNSSRDNWKGETKNETMDPGVGYIIRGQKSNNDPYSITGTFKGVPNNGDKTVPVPVGFKDHSMLLGNPYPSALDADAFLIANGVDGSGVIKGTLYFWTHKTAIQAASNIDPSKVGSGAYAYTSDDYASYNLTGGVGTGEAAISGGTAPTGKIAAGQGFFADVVAQGTVEFNNDMRRIANASIDNTQFYKSTNTKAKTTTIEKNRVWLNLTNAKGAFKQLLIGYVTGASNNYDRAYDGISYNGNSFIDFYSIVENNPLTIQGRALPFQETDEVPLGFTSTIAGAFTIAIDQTDGTLSNQNIYLVDKLTNTTQNLKEQAYTFTTNKGVFNNRFKLTYKTEASLGTENIIKTTNAVIISQNEDDIKITSSSELINEVFVFDITGKLLLHKTKVNSRDLIITDFSIAQQMILVQVKLQNGQTINKKIIY